MSNELRRLILLIIVLCISAVVVLLFVTAEDANLNTTQAKEYVAKNHENDTSASNAVTAVYLNYRFFDTLFESLILLVSVLAVIRLSWSGNRMEQ
jgi:multicomponent Na+:H+ antiporter subunit B